MLPNSWVSQTTTMVTIPYRSPKVIFHVLAHVMQLHTWSRQPPCWPEKPPSHQRSKIIISVRSKVDKMRVADTQPEINLVIPPHPRVKAPTQRVPNHMVPWGRFQKLRRRCKMVPHLGCFLLETLQLAWSYVPTWLVIGFIHRRCSCGSISLISLERRCWKTRWFACLLA